MSAFLGFFQRGKILFYSSVVNTKKFIGTSCHVDKVRLSLLTLLIHEGVHGIIDRRTFNQSFHDQEKRFA